MLKLHEGHCNVAASDTRALLKQCNDTMRAGLTLAQSVIDSLEGSGVSAIEEQKILRLLNKSITQSVEQRHTVVEVMKRLLIVKDRSNCAETDLGCGYPWEDLDTETGYAPDKAPKMVDHQVA